MATIPTPEQGKPILDFSAGTFDGNSNLFQSRNGATEHVSGDDVADYVNTSRIYNGLDTTAKTTVGAINEINRKGLGDIDDVNVSSPADGEVLAYDGTSSKWVNREIEADAVAYDNTASGLTATNVQGAVDSIVKDLLKDYVKVKYVDVRCSSLTRGMNLSVNIDNGYKFLCWQSVGSSNGWITSFPVYIEKCFSTTGGVYWNGTLPTEDNRSVRFWYYEIKNI